MRRLILASKILLRDWKSGDLAIVLFSLVIALACMASINLLTDRVERAVTSQASVLLGGDMIFVSNILPTTQLRKQVDQLNLRQSLVVRFFSVIRAKNNLSLASVKAVDASYPLEGKLLVADKPFELGSAPKHGLAPGEVWVDSRLAASQQLKIGDTVKIGAAHFRLTKILISEPDIAGSVFAFTPRVIMNTVDLPKTKIVQPGSRVEYRLLLAGKQTDLKKLEKNVLSQKQYDGRILRSRAYRPSIKNTFDRAKEYLNLASLISVLLAAISIAMAVQRYSIRQRQTVALLRCFGMLQKEIILLYSFNLFLLGCLGVILGLSIAFVLQFSLENWFQTLFVNPLPAVRLLPALFSAGLGFLLLFLFAMPPLISLKNVTALEVIQQQVRPKQFASLYAVFATVFFVNLFLYWYTNDWRLTLIILLGSSLLIACLAAIAFLVLLGLQRLSHRFSLPWRFGVKNLMRRWRLTLVQIVGFSFTAMILFLLQLLRSDVFIVWQNQIPEKAPNYFAININPNDTEKVKAYLKKNQIQTAGIYPIVRGRLRERNGIPILSTVKGSQRQDNALYRVLNFTFLARLPDDNKIVRGQFWSENTKAIKQVSVEEGVAKRIGLKMGETLGFRIADKMIEAKITSMRHVDWTNFHPNFFMIFPPALIQNLPKTYMTSFYLPKDRSVLLADIVKQFSSITLISVEEIIDQIRSITLQFSNALIFILMFALVAAIAVLIAAVTANLDERRSDSKILLALGASKRIVKMSVLSEFIILGLLAGLVAVIVGNLILFYLMSQIFHLPWQFNYFWTLLTPFISLCLITVTARVVMR